MAARARAYVLMEITVEDDTPPEKWAGWSVLETRLQGAGEHARVLRAWNADTGNEINFLKGGA